MIGEPNRARRVFRRLGSAGTRRRASTHRLLGALRVLRTRRPFGSLGPVRLDRLAAVACRTRLAVAALATTPAAAP